MLKITRSIWLGLLGLSGALAFAVPAQAADLKAQCVLEGVIKTFDKDSWPLRVLKPVPVSGGTGIYEFARLRIDCVGTSKSMVPETVSLDAESTGWYDNEVCWAVKSKAWSKTLEITNNEKYAEALDDQKYKVVFSVPFGRGDFYWHDWDKPKGPDPKDALGDGPDDEKNPESKDWQLAGQFQVGWNIQSLEGKLFVPPDVATNRCGDSFTVRGTIHVDPRPR